MTAAEQMFNVLYNNKNAEEDLKPNFTTANRNRLLIPFDQKCLPLQYLFHRLIVFCYQ